MALSIRDTERHPPLWGGFLIGRTGDAQLEAPELEPRAEPWAWYRTDDIAHVGDGQEVGQWPDRSGNGYDLVPAGSGDDLPYFSAGAIDGHGALRYPGGSSVRSLQWDYITAGQANPEPFPENQGFTVVQVHEDAHGYTMKCILGFGTVNGAEMYSDISPTWRGEFLIAGFAGAGSGEAGSAAWQGLVGVMAPDVVEIYSSGQEWNYGGSGYHSTATQAEWDAVDWTVQFIEIDPNWTGTGVAEYIVFAYLLDPDVDLIDFGADGVMTIHGYLAARYPSLGIS